MLEQETKTETEKKPTEEKPTEEKPTEEKPTEKKPMADNIVYIGAKPFLNYITAVTRQFQTGQKEIMVIARGKFISKAVDVAEVIRKKFMKDENIILDNIKIDSKEFEREFNGQKKSISVSEIELNLKKP